MDDLSNRILRDIEQRRDLYKGRTHNPNLSQDTIDIARYLVEELDEILYQFRFNYRPKDLDDRDTGISRSEENVSEPS